MKSVSHARILSKLPANCKIRRDIRWFESYLINRKHFIVFDGVRSAIQSIISEEPQGSLLGPLFFNILVNNLQLVVSKSIIYADDVVICASEENSVEKLKL